MGHLLDKTVPRSCRAILFDVKKAFKAQRHPFGSAASRVGARKDEAHPHCVQVRIVAMWRDHGGLTIVFRT